MRSAARAGVSAAQESVPRWDRCRAEGRRDRGHRARAVRRDAAGGHGRRRDAHRAPPGDRRAAPRATCSTAAAAASASTSSTRRAAALVLELCERADALIEGFRPGVMERLGLGPDDVPGAQPAARLRPHDRLGPGRPARAGAPGTTSTTSRSAARCTRSAARGERAAAAAQPGRRLRRRRHAARVRRGVRAARGAALGPRPGRRRGDGRRRGAADGDVLRHARGRLAHASSAARTCSTPARTSTTPTRPPTAARGGRRDRAAVLRRAAATPRPRRPRACRRRWTARAGRELKQRLAARCSSRRRAREWCALLEGSDACFAPVLSWARRPSIRTARARERSSTVGGVVQPAPAPRFSRTQARSAPPRTAGEDTEAALIAGAWRNPSPGCARWGVVLTPRRRRRQISRLRRSGPWRHGAMAVQNSGDQRTCPASARCTSIRSSRAAGSTSRRCASTFSVRSTTGASWWSTRRACA